MTGKTGRPGPKAQPAQLSPPALHKERTILEIIAAGLAIAVVGGIVWRVRMPVVRVAPVRRGSLEQHIVVSGRARVPNRVQVSARLSALVVAVPPSEGHRVNLDTESSNAVFALLRQFNRERDTTLVVTHDERSAAACDRVIEMGDGRLTKDSGRPGA